MSIHPAGQAVLSRVDSQMAPIRMGEPLWPGPGFQVWEQRDGEIRRLVGFVPEAAAGALIDDYEARGFQVTIAGALQHA